MSDLEDAKYHINELMQLIYDEEECTNMSLVDGTCGCYRCDILQDAGMFLYKLKKISNTETDNSELVAK